MASRRSSHNRPRPDWQTGLGKATLTNMDTDMDRAVSLHLLVVANANLVLHANRTIHSTGV
ncbi:hypothetical protein VMCG_03395 [Cytospora schulzeri]|uniref:Uncharacterized protein n=1 Tax=Cytospora schulzeri TaxID=448051 RepID=A0A423WWR6_9PEZI|nr:hypothetical protein VMCG_03395 [Valsa malicola]